MIADDFSALVEKVIKTHRQASRRGWAAIKLGGVLFEAGPDGLQIDASQWDMDAVMGDLTRFLQPMDAVEMACRASGWIVERVGGEGGTAYAVVPCVYAEDDRSALAASTTQHASASAAWSAAFSRLQHEPVTPVRRPGFYESLGRNNGFVVRSWDCVEMGDEKDTWYWCATGARAASDQSGIVFSSEIEAWEHCVAAHGLANELIARLADDGFRISHNGLAGWRWDLDDTEGQGPFRSSAAAAENCLLYLESREDDRMAPEATS